MSVMCVRVSKVVGVAGVESVRGEGVGAGFGERGIWFLT